MTDDLISRQAIMKEFANFVRASNNSDFAQTPTWNDAVSLVGSMPSAEPEQRWIPVTERLPEDGKYVLAYCIDDDFMTVEARHKFEAFQITHWMPLPEPFK